MRADPAVFSQITGTAKCLSALLTGVRSLSSVTAQVHSEVIGSNIRLSTVVASVWSFCFMVGAHMKFETTWIRESLPTVLTAVQLLSSVNGLVQFQTELCCKCFSTLITGVRLLYQMNPFMHFEIIYKCEFLPTLVAGMGCLCQVSLHVSFQTTD